jgi:hypothetical protein
LVSNRCRLLAEGDRLTRAVISRVQDEGHCFVGGAQRLGQWVMRLSAIGATEDADADRTAEAIAATGRAVRDAALED